MRLRTGLYYAALATPALAVMGIALVADPARAVPSFARQTGVDCSACHVGGFGPQLTPFGRRFKLTGYTANNGEFNVPLSAMAVGSWTHTAKDQPGGAGTHAGPNDNFALDEVSAFLAGKIAGPVGAFVQVTYDGNEHHVSLDNADIRAAVETQLGGRDLILGASFNNNPTVQDAFNTTPAWGFPYTGSALTPDSNAGTLINGGAEMQVGGASVYAYWNNLLYAEVGVYSRLSESFLSTVGVSRETVVKGTAPYWRLALTHDWSQQSASIGTFGMIADVYPDDLHLSGTDKYTDIGFDASYQWLGDRKDIISANLSYVHEKQDRTGSYALGLAANPRDTLNELKANLSWYHDNAYGLTAGFFRTSGSADPLLYPVEDITGSRLGLPDTTGYVLQADWTPFGKADSWGGSWANLRLGLQYTGYTKFNGAGSNYDGAGRKASDNNTLFLFSWLAF
ncbi:MAG: cytochrome C [Alphaproteobacteria bacterium]|nr:cytochrome C [Alphaproteobacteria bacterium]